MGLAAARLGLDDEQASVPVADFSHELLDQAHFVVAPDHGDIGTPARGQSLARGARSVGR